MCDFFCMHVITVFYIFLFTCINNGEMNMHIIYVLQNHAFRKIMIYDRTGSESGMFISNNVMSFN